jgi:hypothetical protein
MLTACQSVGCPAYRLACLPLASLSAVLPTGLHAYRLLSVGFPAYRLAYLQLVCRPAFLHNGLHANLLACNPISLLAY